jgi:hypothetical protein
MSWDYFAINMLAQVVILIYLTFSIAPGTSTNIEAAAWTLPGIVTKL